MLDEALQFLVGRVAGEDAVDLLGGLDEVAEAAGNCIEHWPSAPQQACSVGRLISTDTASM